MGFQRGADDGAGIIEVECRRGQGEQQEKQLSHRFLGFLWTHSCHRSAGRREKGWVSDEELRVQKEERRRGLLMSGRGGGECGLNARREETCRARQLDRGHRRPPLW
jgi:hypothetical protein